MSNNETQNVNAQIIDDGPGVWKKKRSVSWPLLIAGILLIVLGIACVVWPGQALESIGLIAGLGFLIAGCLGIADFFMTGGFAIFSGWLLFDGIIGILLGAMFLAEPLASGAALSWLIALVVVCSGIVQIVSAISVRKIAPGVWGMILVGGILTILIGWALFAEPATLSLFVGLFAIFYGALTTAAAVKIPKIFG